MGGGTFTPLTRNWQWWHDDAETPTIYYNTENGVFSGNFTTGDIIRLRFNIAETGGKAGNGQSVTLQYSTNGSNWYALAADAAWQFADSGYVVSGNTVATLLLTDTATSGYYVEAQVTFSFAASSNNEFDFVITKGSTHVNGQVYYFRPVVAGTGREPATGETRPQITATFLDFIPRTKNWRVYKNDAAEPSTAYANENTAFNTTDVSTSIFRLRWNLTDIGGGGRTNASIGFEWSINQTDWVPFNSGDWLYGNGLATFGNTITSFKLTGTNKYGIYIESSENSYTFITNTSTNNEFDVAVIPGATFQYDTSYYFRPSINGFVASPSTGYTYPNFSVSLPARIYGAILKIYNGSQWIECPSSKAKLYNTQWITFLQDKIKIYRTDGTPGWYLVRFNG